MQKVLTEMNVQLSTVLSDLSGMSGMKIIGAILKGERDPWKLAALVEPEVKATPENIARSLEGNWREELLFVLRQQVELYRIYQEKIADCDLQLRKHLESLGSKVDPGTQPIGPRPKGKKNSRNAPSFDLRTELYRITGIDWSQINGIDVLTAQTVIAEAGADLSAFPGEKQFASWLGLCPTNEQSGGQILNRRTRKVVNRASVAFRNAAVTLLRSQSYLGAQYRRLRTRLGAPKAITAMARKLACLYYRLIKHGQQYVDKGIEYYEATISRAADPIPCEKSPKAWPSIGYSDDCVDHGCKVSGKSSGYPPMAFQVSRISCRVARPAFRRGRLQSRFEDLGDTFRNTVLDREHIIQTGVKPFRPEFEAILAANEMNVNSDNAGNSMNRAFEDGIDPSSLAARTGSYLWLWKRDTVACPATRIPSMRQHARINSSVRPSPK